MFFKIDWHETQVSGQLYTRLLKASPLPYLCGGMIDFKDAQNFRQVRSAVCERVQAGAEDRVLRHSLSNWPARFPPRGNGFA